MATFRVQNLSGGRLAVPPPLDVILPPGATADVDAVSADTPAIKDLIDRNLAKVFPVNSGAASDDVEAATLGRLGQETKTTIGTAADPVAMTAGQSMTWNHALGVAASKVHIYNQANGNLAVAAAATVTTNDGTDLVIANNTGGALSIVVEAGFDAGVDNEFAGNIAQDDATVSVA